MECENAMIQIAQLKSNSRPTSLMLPKSFQTLKCLIPYLLKPTTPSHQGLCYIFLSIYHLNF